HLCRRDAAHTLQLEGGGKGERPSRIVDLCRRDEGRTSREGGDGRKRRRDPKEPRQVVGIHEENTLSNPLRHGRRSWGRDHRTTRRSGGPTGKSARNPAKIRICDSVFSVERGLVRLISLNF